ncbi:MAG TPA: cobalamin-binding protein [Bryobacteraceae bacterium]|nr:cobalamin-binding protein [Bryobacteraceae bacterium]
MPRIVSLIASATEIVDALGEIDHLVGRSHECDYPERVKALPCCTAPRIPVDGSSREIDGLVKASARNSISIYDVYENVLNSLEPTHILTQIQCEVCAVSLRDIEDAMARGLRGTPEVVSLQPDSLAGIWAGIRRVAASLGIERRGDAVVENLQQRMCSWKGQAASPPRVACLEWLEPLMAGGNWTPELLDMAGAVNLFGAAGTHAPWMRWEDLLAADPDVIVAAPCGFDMARTTQEMYWLTDRPEWFSLRAVRNGRVYLADGNQYFNRPGPRVVETLQILAEILYPDQFPPSLRGSGWLPFGSAL